ncbi:MAG: hypothetical protein A4E44_00063 [Methanosaeta sp. PtaB.Bin018]|nr:MAG: hypothetical protein A4E44_00063 [Methanosaeta sp. PtaB.Bin018]
MGHLTIRIGSVLILLLAIIGSSLAGTFDFNPGQEAVKHRNDVTSDVTGTGYVMEYVKVNTNNLSMLEYNHGSGSMDFADILYDEQKTTSNTIYWIDYTTGAWTKGNAGPNSAITYTRQYDNVQSPTAFAYGTGYYAAHPVIYNSLIKDKNIANSYQESASMHRQVEYARALKGDIAIDLNCTAPTATASGKGSISMKIDDEVTQGTLHVGEFLGMPMYKANVPTFGAGEARKSKNGYKQGIKDPIIMIDTDYIGDFSVQKTMKIDIVKYGPPWMEDWLPCCMGGFFDIPSYNFDKERGSQKGIFDCTCRNESIKTYQPKWNTTMAQFPTAKYQYKP